MTTTIETEARADLVERWIARDAYSNVLIALFIGRDAVIPDPMPPEDDIFSTGFDVGSELAIGDLAGPMTDALWPAQDGELEENPEFATASLRAQILASRMLAALACVGSSHLARLAAAEAARAENTVLRIAAKSAQADGGAA